MNVIFKQFEDNIQSYFQIQFINADIDRTTGLNILSHYQKSNRRLNYQNSSESIIKLDERNTEKVAKLKIMMFFNSIKENLTMIDISNYVVHWNMKNLKQEKEGSIKRFWIISGITTA